MTELPRHGSQFARRDFLKLSSLAVAGLAGGALPVFALPLGQRVSRSLMSIGFAAEEPDANRPVRLDAAAHLLTSDPTFLSRDALVTIRSSARALSQSTSRGAAIDVVYPALGFQPDRYPAYRAWSCRIDDHGVESGGGVAFRVPVDGTNGLQLCLSNFKADDAPTTAESVLRPAPDETITLSLAALSAEPKLQRGVYVIGYRDPADGPIPAWSSMILARRANDLVIPNAAFSYVVLRVDYAPQN